VATRVSKGTLLTRQLPLAPGPVRVAWAAGGGARRRWAHEGEGRVGGAGEGREGRSASFFGPALLSSFKPSLPLPPPTLPLAPPFSHFSPLAPPSAPLGTSEALWGRCGRVEFFHAHHTLLHARTPPGVGVPHAGQEPAEGGREGGGEGRKRVVVKGGGGGAHDTASLVPPFPLPPRRSFPSLLLPPSPPPSLSLPSLPAALGAVGIPRPRPLSASSAHRDAPRLPHLLHCTL
jgi:hypothetical protein